MTPAVEYKIQRGMAAHSNLSSVLRLLRLDGAISTRGRTYTPCAPPGPPAPPAAALTASEAWARPTAGELTRPHTSACFYQARESEVPDCVISGAWCKTKRLSSPHVRCVPQLCGSDRGPGEDAGRVSAHVCQEFHGAAMLPTVLGTPVPA